MTEERARLYESEAKKKRSNSEYFDAGELFTLASYEYLGTGVPGFPATVWCEAVYTLLLGSVCYRLANKEATCINRCEQGILIAEDLNDRHLPGPEDEYWFERARRGVWYEYIGDFRTVAGIDGADTAYDEAKTIYRKGKDPETGFAEQEHMRLLEFFEQVAGLDPMEDEDWHRIRQDMPFTHWVDYKAEVLPKKLDELYERGEWSIN